MDISDLLQWSGVLVSASTCFIAASLSFFVFMEQRRNSEESSRLTNSVALIETEQKRARTRDEFHRWVMLQGVALQEDAFFLIESISASSTLHSRTSARLSEIRVSITRRMYELQIFSGDERSIRNAVRQLIGVFPDARSLEVICLAAKALDDLAVSEWLQNEATKLKRTLYGPQLVDAHRWTG
jgi:hypothetical protein